MEGTWNVFFGDKPVGICHIWREGLYCHVSCRCGKVTEGICRLILDCGDQSRDLGILVPVEGGFGLDRKLPAKQLPPGEPRFSVKQPGHRTGHFIPVREEEPFGQLSRLREARFAWQDGQVGVILK